MKKHGNFIISLDFELFWGVFDSLNTNTYYQNLISVNGVIDKLLELSNKYDVKYTFATVGMLFAENKTELLKYLPNKKPNYSDKTLNPYSQINKVKDDKIYFAKNLIKKIASCNHEIATHTFSHYNCLAKGQNSEEFKSDLIAAIEIAKSLNINITSIVFPKNETNPEYLLECQNLGIKSYRGNETNFIYKARHNKYGFLLLHVKLLRLLDSYINITGHNTYQIQNKNRIINLPSSRFLRPYSKALKILEPLKIKRIKSSMNYAAKNNETFHLWWHPHNFGININENFKNLEEVLNEYKKLNSKYNFKSTTMSSLTSQINNL